MKRKLSQDQMEKKFEKLYDNGGACACYDEADKLKLKTWLYCKQCDCETPRYKDTTTCLCCGSTS